MAPSMPLPDDDSLLQRTTVFRTRDLTSARVPRMPVLVVLRGVEVGRRYLLNEDALVVGRHPERAQLLIVSDQQVSAVHCRIERSAAGDGWDILDLQSTNGTFLEGARIERAALRDGARIVLGETVLKFTFHDEVEAEFHQTVDQLMNIDDLTGLPVQRVYQQRVQEMIRGCIAGGRPLAVFMMDLDGLKKLNDTHGHLVGGRSIGVIGARLGALLAPVGGVVSRFGGDEFSACVVDCDADGAGALGERMRAAVADEAVEYNSLLVNPTISIGFACAPAAGRTLESLTRRADEALYRAKAAGRNCVRA